ncbi:MAG: hypothetical protein MUP85_01815, partial [Candidatus Lokiarchaeota archaeon]|nr:hypothetical protein [Candidatus Lokiarchaeota archaeon]
MDIEKFNEVQLEKERLEKERLEREQLEKERIEKQKMENKLFPNYCLFMIPSWSDLLGYPALGTYVHHPVSKIISDTVIFLSGYDYSIETAKGTLYYLFGLGYYFLKFELESGKYITDNRIVTGLVLTDFVYDHMATSGNITLEDDRDVIIAEKVIKVPVDLSYKSENHLTFIKGALMRNIFIPHKDIFLEMMERIGKDDSYQIAKDGYMLLSTHWDFYNQILVSEKMRGNLDTSYLNSTAGLNGIIFTADQLLQETISNVNLNIIEDNINSLKNSYSNLEFDPMYLFSIIEKVSPLINSDIPQISKQRDSNNRKTAKESIFASAEDRLNEFVSWPVQFKRMARKEPPVLPKIVEQPTYLQQNEIESSDIGNVEMPDYKQEKFELKTLKSEKVEFKPLPNHPKAEIKQILLYLKNVIEENYAMKSIGQAFEIARESMRQIGVSSTTTQQKKIWEMSKYANIYLKKEPGFGLPINEKLELTQKIDKWLFEINEEARKERERIENVRLEKERIKKLEEERKAREAREKERKEIESLERIRKEKERLEQEKLEKNRLEEIEREKKEKIRLEREIIEREREELEA